MQSAHGLQQIPDNLRQQLNAIGNLHNGTTALYLHGCTTSGIAPRLENLEAVLRQTPLAGQLRL